MQIRTVLNNTATLTYRGAFAQYESALRGNEPTKAKSAQGLEFEVVTERRRSRVQRLHNGKEKLEHGRFGHFYLSRRWSDDSDQRRRLNREILAAELSALNEPEQGDPIVAASTLEDDCRWWEGQSSAGSDRDEVYPHGAGEHTEDGGAYSQDSGEEEDDNEPKSVFELEMLSVNQLHLRPNWCHACGFQDCRCDGTASDWGPVRRTLQCF